MEPHDPSPEGRERERAGRGACLLSCDVLCSLGTLAAQRPWSLLPSFERPWSLQNLFFIKLPSWEHLYYRNAKQAAIMSSHTNCSPRVPVAPSPPCIVCWKLTTRLLFPAPSSGGVASACLTLSILLPSAADTEVFIIIVIVRTCGITITVIASTAAVNLRTPVALCAPTSNDGRGSEQASRCR